MTGSGLTSRQIEILKTFAKSNKVYSPFAPHMIRTVTDGAMELAPGYALFGSAEVGPLETLGLIERCDIGWDTFWTLTDLGIACRRMAG